MWTIAQLKENAKAALKNYYGAAIAVSLIAGLLGGGGGGSVGSSSSYKGNDSSSDSSYVEEFIGGVDSEYGVEFDEDGSIVASEENKEKLGNALTAVLSIVGIVMIFIILFSIAFGFFVSSPIIVGQNRFYLDARAGTPEIGRLFYQFRAGRYMDTVKTMVIYNIKIALWTMLLIVPGIIKAYEYLLVPYILAENPQIDRKRVFEISKRTMDGEKMNFFLLQLSFFGWGLLAALTRGIGSIFLAPYIQATNAEFYSCMREKALAQGIASPFELPGGFGADQFGGFSSMNTPVPPAAPQSFSGTQDTSYNSNFGTSQSVNSTSVNAQGTYDSGGKMSGIELPDTPESQAEQAPKGYVSGAMDDLSVEDVSTDILDDPNSSFQRTLTGAEGSMDSVEDDSGLLESDKLDE
ncbi:MAG: DUF975 family protein [Huintestinicola sp.]